MAQSDKAKMLKVVLVIFAVVAIIYGLVYFIVPGTLVTLSGADPVDFEWLRWPGGVIIALGIGALLVARKPEKQNIFVFICALNTLLAGLAKLYCLIMKEYSGSIMFIVMPTVLLLVISGLLWWGRQRAKEIL